MKVEQIYTIVNNLTQQYIGEETVTNTDLSNIVDIGEKVINLDNLDKYVNSLIDQIAKIVFVDRPYTTSIPSLYMDGWEYGAIMEKIQYDELPQAQQNDSWELQNGTSYDPNIFKGPKVSAKFFSKKVTYDIQMSFAHRQVKSAFQNLSQLNAFFSMIETAIQDSMTVKMDELAMGTLNYMTGLTLDNANGNRAVNLLSTYNSRFGTTLTADKCLTAPEFIRYAAYIMGLYESRLTRLSTLFNCNGQLRHTPTSRQKIILLSEFASAADVYLQSDTFHNNYVSLPNADKVPYWQGPGQNYSFSDTSKINIKIKTDQKGSDGNVTRVTKTVTKSGILGVMFDRYAVGIANLDKRVTTNWNGRAEFYNNWYKFDCGYFDDPAENFVVFYAA